MSYLETLRQGFAQVQACALRPLTRLRYLAEYIFGFVTEDAELADLFARGALEVCLAISAQTTFEYIKDRDQYEWYILMCNMPFFRDKIEWGVSIRGAWWWPRDDIQLPTCGLWRDGRQLGDLVFTHDEWVEFVAAVIEFGNVS